MKTTVEAINSPTIYQFRSEPLELRIYSATNWITQNHQFIQRGSPTQRDSWYIPVPLEITGGDITLIPIFELDSTEDAPFPFNLTARYTARLVTRGGRMIGVFPSEELSSFYVPAVASLTWDMLVQYNHIRSVDFPASYVTNLLASVQALIDDALGSRDYASSARLGLGYSSVDPADPIFPTFIEESDPRVDQAVADGSDVLIAGEATTVFSAAVLPLSMIEPVGLEDTITGRLRAVNKVEAVSFDVVSDNGADFGAFGWSLRNL